MLSEVLDPHLEIANNVSNDEQSTYWRYLINNTV